MKKLLPFIVLIFSGYAQAGVFAEPFLGIENSAVNATSVAGVKSGSSSSGFAYGARLGYRLSNPVWFAAEYKGSSGKDDSTNPTEYKNTAMSVVFGYDMGKYNLWAGYGFSDKQTLDMSPDIDITGTNFKFGGGYKAANNVSLNLELVIQNYTKAGMNGVDVDIDQVFSKYTSSTVLLTVSFPFGQGK